MTYSIFTSTGNLVDAFDERDAAIAALTDIVRAEPESADEVFLVAQDDEARWARPSTGLRCTSRHSSRPPGYPPTWKPRGSRRGRCRIIT